jgi:16S rRNA (cytidine1402-2'-O)-methyltransferase
MATLFVIPTPIGNLKDITLRSIEILKSASIILTEDTRNTFKLLTLLGIETSGKHLIPFHDHNEASKIKEIIDLLIEGNDISIVSDAGTPGINDPGFKLIREIRNNHMDKIKIEVLPGPSAVTTALSGAGLPTDKFMFLGYLPRKEMERKNLFKKLIKLNDIINTTFIFFESPFRIAYTLTALADEIDEKSRIAVCNELTKRNEKVLTGTPKEVIEFIKSNKVNLKGEITLLLNINIKNG